MRGFKDLSYSFARYEAGVHSRRHRIGSFLISSPRRRVHQTLTIVDSAYRRPGENELPDCGRSPSD